MIVCLGLGLRVCFDDCVVRTRIRIRIRVSFDDCAVRIRAQGTL